MVAKYPAELPDAALSNCAAGTGGYPLPAPQTAIGTHKLDREYLPGPSATSSGKSTRRMTVTSMTGSRTARLRPFDAAILLAGVESICPVSPEVSHPERAERWLA